MLWIPNLICILSKKTAQYECKVRHFSSLWLYREYWLQQDDRDAGVDLVDNQLSTLINQ